MSPCDAWASAVIVAYIFINIFLQKFTFFFLPRTGWLGGNLSGLKCWPLQSILGSPSNFTVSSGPKPLLHLFSHWKAKLHPMLARLRLWQGQADYCLTSFNPKAFRILFNVYLEKWLNPTCCERGGEGDGGQTWSLLLPRPFTPGPSSRAPLRQQITRVCKWPDPCTWEAG